MSESAVNHTIHLAPIEAECLALRLVARHLRLDTDWIDWGEVPHLSEDSWALLSDELEVLADRFWARSHAIDRMRDVDSIALLQEAEG